MSGTPRSIEFDFEHQAPLNGQRLSIRPVLDLLASRPFARTPFVYWHIATIAELQHRLDQWAARRGAIPILYIAGHGQRGIVNPGDGFGAPDHVELEAVIAGTI